MREPPQPGDNVLVFVPPLVALLLHAEKKKGAPLTESEVLAIRDDATCIVLPFQVALAGDEARGYVDIVAEDCWQEWQRARIELSVDEV